MLSTQDFVYQEWHSSIELKMFGDLNLKNRTGVWHFVSVTKQTNKYHPKLLATDVDE